ncbi:MAG: UDP-glucose 4-epimerase GalE [Cyclobacteriaceae bacterium]
MSKVLVTGGLGFIGSHTSVELINKGYEVFILDNLSNTRIEVLERIEQITGRKPGFLEVDLTNRHHTDEVFKNQRFDSIIHFAASKAVGESVEKPLLYYHNNLASLINLLELSGAYSIGKFIFSSSCTVYGQPEVLPVTENTPVLPAESPYGNTKQIGEEIIRDFCNVNEALKAISLRYFNPIGAHDSSLIGELPLGVPSNLVPYLIQTAAGIRNELSVFGGDYETRDGTCIRDYIHVSDVAKAHIAALELTPTMKNNYDIFNIGTGQGYTVLEVIESFEKVTGEKLNYKITDRRPGDIEKIFADTSKANKLLNWKAEKDLNDMMSSAWKWQLSLSR